MHIFFKVHAKIWRSENQHCDATTLVPLSVRENITSKRHRPTSVRLSSAVVWLLLLMLWPSVVWLHAITCLFLFFRVLFLLLLFNEQLQWGRCALQCLQNCIQPTGVHCCLQGTDHSTTDPNKVDLDIFMLLIQEMKIEERTQSTLLLSFSEQWLVF